MKYTAKVTRDTLESAMMEQHRVGMGFVMESVWVQAIVNGPTAEKLEVLSL